MLRSISTLQLSCNRLHMVATLRDGMRFFDWAVLSAYFTLMIAVGLWARTKVRDARDFFTAGGAMPWWLSGVSHHMSGYSSAVFVGYAALAYTQGFDLYIWWACSIAIALLIGAGLFAPRWARLRHDLGFISPLEFLATRYSVATQQLLAWSGVFLKIFDVGAKWSSAALLLQVFAGVPFVGGILLTGGVTLIYSVVGGLWADALTDFSQFLIQIVAGTAMLVAVLLKLGGISALWTIWGRLPAHHAAAFNSTYTPWFALGFLVVSTLSYNGGTWNLAQRFMAAPSDRDARRAALLSAFLYLLWPLVLFFPMWAAPILLPGLADPSQSYALLTRNLLPDGLVGLVLAGLFAHTMAMTSSDANAVAAVVVRDILPVLRRYVGLPEGERELFSGRVTTFLFLALSMVLGMFADRFGGVMGLILLWYGALVGPIAVPMMLGLLPTFRRCGPTAAVLSLLAGAITFVCVKFIFADAIAGLPGSPGGTAVLAGPVLSSIVVYVGVGSIERWRSPAADMLLDRLHGSQKEPIRSALISTPEGSPL